MAALEESYEDSMRPMDTVQLQSNELSYQPEKSGNGRKKYGQMLVLYEGDSHIVTLGPDYWCFLPTFIIFCVVSFLMTRFVFNYSTNIYFQLVTVLICGGMCLSYFLVATSNPGIVLEEDFTDSEEEENPMSQETISRKRLCRKCNIRVSKGTYHCSDCDVCIREYDHHCPWTSKCIGGGNLCRFYVFLGMVPVYLIYVFISFATLMSAVAIQNSTSHLKGKHHLLI